MTDFDSGPPKALVNHFANLPDYTPEERQLFWHTWGPIFYRGRLDGSAKLLGIASDPGPTERIACRTLVGDAGQRVQGFLAKLGLTHSYVLVNAHPYALHPGKASKGLKLLAEKHHKDWRNVLYDLVAGSKLEAIVAFGRQAQEALRLWDSAPALNRFEVPHPSDHDEIQLVSEWSKAIPKPRQKVTPDPDGDAPELWRQVHGVRLRADPETRPALRPARLAGGRLVGPRGEAPSQQLRGALQGPPGA